MRGDARLTERAQWKLNWFLQDFGYDTDLFNRDQVDEKALLHLRGVVRTSITTLNGRSYQNLDAFAPERDWDALDCTSVAPSDGRGSSDGLLLHPNKPVSSPPSQLSLPLFGRLAG